MTNDEILKIIDFLNQKKLLTVEQYDELKTKVFPNFLEAEKQIRRRVLVSDEDWTQAKALFFGMEYANLSGKVINAEILNILPQDLAENYRIVIKKEKISKSA